VGITTSLIHDVRSPAACITRELVATLCIATAYSHFAAYGVSVGLATCWGNLSPKPLTRMPFLPTASSGASWHDCVHFIHREGEACAEALAGVVIPARRRRALDGSGLGAATPARGTLRIAFPATRRFLMPTRVRLLEPRRTGSPIVSITRCSRSPRHPNSKSCQIWPRRGSTGWGENVCLPPRRGGAIPRWYGL